MPTIDLGPETQRVGTIVARVGDDMLDRPTPCPSYSVGDLVDHIGGAALAFTGAARKELDGLASEPPSGDASRLKGDWRSRIPRDLASLAAAWRDPEAWTGMTRAGGVDLPAEAAGIIAMDEVVIHGWDLSRATGQEYQPDEDVLRAVEAFLAGYTGSAREGVFGPPVAVAAGAPLLDRVIGLSGRDPAWSPG